MSRCSDCQRLEAQVKQLQETVGTLITWIVTNANSPISTFEAAQLLKMLRGER